MQKHETITLNQQALAEKLREQQLKQWWVARQIGVRPLTINRWLTGKVRRIGLENLARLAELLKCPPAELVRSEDEHAGATPREQSEAASLLTSPESKQLFFSNQQPAVYEQLLKALLHPNMTARQLTDIYSALCSAAVAQGKFTDVLSYARRGLDYAVRSGQSSDEFRLRHNLITAEGQCGKLSAAISGLEDLAAAAESIGNQRACSLACINLCYALRIAGRLGEAIANANIAMAFCDTTDEARPQGNALSNCGLLALDLGRYALAARLRREGSLRADLLKEEHRRCSEYVFDMLCSSLQDGPVDLDGLLVAMACFSTQALADGLSMWPVAVARRAGALELAWKLFEQLASLSTAYRYDSPFVLEEQARLYWAAGDRRKAQSMREEANALLLSLDMGARCCDDPAAEIGAQMRIPLRPRLRDPWAGPRRWKA